MMACLFWLPKPNKQANKTRQLRRLYQRLRRRLLRERRKCEAQVVCRGGPSTEVHHLAGREGTRLIDERNLVVVCRECHEWIHSHPRAARREGLLLLRNAQQERKEE